MLVKKSLLEANTYVVFLTMVLFESVFFVNVIFVVCFFTE